MPLIRKFKSASKILREEGLRGLYEFFMFRYFWKVFGPLFPKKAKEWAEMRYWKGRAKEGAIRNSYYQRYYTEHFDLDCDFYDGKRILDIGCGPQGSLEWAANAAERVGVDALVDEYKQFGIDEHEMKYIDANSEDLPLEDDYFDVVASFNSLDHVDNVEKTIKEMVRVLKPGGRFLLMVDVGHDPTMEEPHCLDWNVMDCVSDSMDVVLQMHYEQRGGTIRSAEANVPFDHDNPAKRSGALSIMLEKKK